MGRLRSHRQSLKVILKTFCEFSIYIIIGIFQSELIRKRICFLDANTMAKVKSRVAISKSPPRFTEQLLQVFKCFDIDLYRELPTDSFTRH